MPEMVEITMRRCVSCGAEALADTPLSAFPHFRNCPKLPHPGVAAFCKVLDEFKPIAKALPDEKDLTDG